MQDQPDLTFVDEAIDRIGQGEGCAIPILQALQKHYRYLPRAAMVRVCEKTRITPAQLEGVSTFYAQFRHKPAGEHTIRVCVGTSCHVKDAGRIQEAFRTHLGLSGAEDTSADGVFTLESVACLGCCTLAPAVTIDSVTYGYLTPETVPVVLSNFLEVRRLKNGIKGSEDPLGTGVFSELASLQGEIRVGLGSCCVAKGSDSVRDALEAAIERTGSTAVVKGVGCVGMCHHTPLVEVIAPDGKNTLYSGIVEETAGAVVGRHFRPKGMMRKIRSAVSRALDGAVSDEIPEPVTRFTDEVRDPQVAAFLSRQLHIATEHCGVLGPTDFNEYRRHNGFKALEKCLREMIPAEVIDEVVKSRLRGRGGGGFPTGPKWLRVREAAGEPKYVICNGDEGDPGAFMDRMLLESYPYRIIEGMTIAAYAVGANEGIFYIRAEYPLAVRRIRSAIKRCEDQGILGENILDSGFDLNLRVVEGAGAFVCGEETALLESIEGKRGMPRLRPPYPAEKGLWDRPTLVNNVESYALVPWIIRHGSDAFAGLGTEGSKGTKVFSLAGKVARGGLIEVPMGISIGEIVEEIGGGVAGGKRFKAVQIGGPSGGCVPASLAHTPVDYESLRSMGAIMGSGGLVVLDESDCMVDMARYFLEFTQGESCGQCTFCRVGTRRMLEILERICEGKGKPGDLDLLETLCGGVSQGSLCGLGQTAPNPVRSTLRYFRDEYEAHLEGRCPAGRCKGLITYSITSNCIGCTLCAQRCPVDAIPTVPYQIHSIDSDRCTRCNACLEVCPMDAVQVA
jgi:NADH:ubiquinone oxidoreductase subunit F (NADH-binding)/NADH:ubiquinone oxidoreductase subunit E/Pyruvate/2-oxoacid:ferredoxin oxidoreductase delta subunit